MKKLIGILSVLLLSLCLTVCAFAADTLYVKNAAAGNGNGANADNATTLDAAITALNGKGGTIILCEEVYLRKSITIPEQSGDLTIKAEDGGSLYVQVASLSIAKNTNKNTFTFDTPIKTLPSALTVFAGFNSVRFTKNCTVDGSIHFVGGVDVEKAPSNTTTGEVEEKKRMNAACITDLPYTITVENGVFGSFLGGSYRDNSADVIGAMTAPLTVNISGGTFNCTKSFDANDAIKGGRAFSLSGMSLLADDATLSITGGTFNTPIYVHGYLGETTTAASAASMITNSDAKYYAADGDVTVQITGGTFTEGCVEISAEQTAASYNRLHRGNLKVTVEKGATFAAGTVFDATQVKAYAGKNEKATLSFYASGSIVEKRFDTVNGVAQTYEEPIRIACIGDSITQGTSAIMNGKTDYENWAYPAQLYKQAIANGDDVIVSNYGCGATKVLDYSGLYYKAGLAYTLSAKETDATYVVIGLGTNDAGVVANTVGQIDHFKREYEDFVLSYEACADTKTVFGTSAIYRYRYAYNAASGIRVLQDEVLTKLKAEGKKCQYVDLYALLLTPALNGSLLHTDLLHPNAKGYTLYADAIYNAIFKGVYYNENFKTRSDIWVDQIKGSVNGDGSQGNPVKHLSVAFAMAEKEATIHIVGVYTDTNYKEDQQWNTTILPMNVEKLTIVGEGANPEWRVSSKLMYIFGDTTFDNIKMYYSLGTGGNALYIFCGFNNVTFTETFSTPAPEYAILHAGFCVHDDLISQSRYTPAESVSSDKDCTITVNGGKYLYYLGGNLHYNNSNADQAPYGTYSGNMTLRIGSGAFFKDKYAGGSLVGMNYMAGTLDATVNAWNKDMPIYSFSKLTNQSVCANSYDESNNTGADAIAVRTSLPNSIVLSGDLSADGRVTLADVLLAAKYAQNGMPSGFDVKTYFYQSKLTNENANRLAAILAN